ncbi:hypothetical protein B0H10DRAFT_1968037 [Mycena sp. CBHHK59/15]|nr:hypothetical protein B0H10DRAFT_1968037 [Mycena sp. CBHHK59/15]
MCFSLRPKASKHNIYILQSRLRGHSGAIARLRATEDRRFLVSGGTDGTKVWDLNTMHELGSPKTPESRRATMALVWIKREDDLSEALIYGTQNGQLGLVVFEELYCERLVNPAEITGLAFDAPSSRLAVCHRGGMVQVHALGSTMSLQEVFTLELRNTVPRAIAFSQMYGNERDIMVFGLYGGDIHMLWGSNGKATGDPWTIGALIGDIALDTCKGVLCMDEPSSGTNLYCLEDHTRVKTFPVPVTKQQRLRQVDFLDECRFILSGSDHGVVYVFDHRSGDIVDELRVDPHEWVQTVAAADCAGVSTIFAAKSRDLVGYNKIFVWRKKSKKRVVVLGVGGRGLHVPEFCYHPDVNTYLDLKYYASVEGSACCLEGAMNGAADVQHQQACPTGGGSVGTDIVAEGAADIQHQHARPTSTGKGLGVWAYNTPQHPPPLPTYNVGQWWKRDLADLVIVRCDDVTMVTITTQIIAYHHDRHDRHIGLGGSSTPLPSPPPLLDVTLGHYWIGTMSSHSYHSASRGSRNSRASPPTYLYTISPLQFRRLRNCPTLYADRFGQYGAAEVADFREDEEADITDDVNHIEEVDVTDDVNDIDNLANVFMGLVVTDNGPEVQRQQHSKLFSSRTDFQSSLPDVPLIFHPTSPSEAIWSIQSLVNTASRQKPPTRNERQESTLTDLVRCIRNAHNSLDLVYELYGTNSDHNSARLALDAAAETVITAGKLLRSVKASKNDNELAKLWNNVHAEAVALDKLVDCVGAIVPKADVEVNEVEVEYNTEHHFEDPIGGHDTLPTTLEDALKTFKLEPKTRILATCPSCHYTHEPRVNRLTQEPSYPTHCENFIFRDKHSPAVPCLQPLLEQRQAKLRLIKPFVYPDFTDHLASVLSDPEIAALCNSACDEAWKAVHVSLSADPHGPVSPEEVNNVFEAEFLRSFNGPVPDQFFINRGGRMRIVFQILLDFFNPHGMRKRGNHDSS